MITFSTGQLDSLRDDRALKFAQHLAERARGVHARLCAAMADEDLLADMKTAITASRERGLCTRSDMERFSDLTVLFGPGFEKREDWARKAFERKDLVPRERLETVEATALFLLKDR